MSIKAGAIDECLTYCLRGTENESWGRKTKDGKGKKEKFPLNWKAFDEWRGVIDSRSELKSIEQLMRRIVNV